MNKGNNIHKLGDICAIFKGNTGIMKAIDGEYTMVTLGEENKTHNEYQFDAKAVIIPLVSSTGHGHASMKRVKYFEGKFALGTILCAVIPNNENLVLAKYLHIYLHENREKLLVSLMKGAANVTLSVKKIYDVEVLIPSMETQLKVIKLEQKIIESDDKLVSLFTNQQTLLATLRQAILQEAIQGKLTAEWRMQNPNTEPATELLKRIKTEKMNRVGFKPNPIQTITKTEIPFELPMGWVWCRGSDFFMPMESKRPLGDTFGYIDIASIDNKNHRLTEPRYIPVAEAPSRASRKVYGGSTLFSLVRPYLGNIAFIEEEYSDCIASTGFFVCTPFSYVFPKYLYSLMISGYVIQGLNSFMKGVNSPSINTDDISNFIFPLPPLSEQAAIVEKVEILMQKCTALSEEINVLNTHGKTLLKAMFNETFETKQQSTT